jgi:hypothetical protein
MDKRVTLLDTLEAVLQAHQTGSIATEQLNLLVEQTQELLDSIPAQHGQHQQVPFGLSVNS